MLSVFVPALHVPELTCLHRSFISPCEEGVDKSKKTPLLINQVPAKSLRTHLSPRVKNTYRPYKACRDSRLPLGQRKLQTEELDSLRRELSKIKAQVDSLLKSLESMEQQRDQHTGEDSSIRPG